MHSRLQIRIGHLDTKLAELLIVQGGIWQSVRCPIELTEAA